MLDQQCLIPTLMHINKILIQWHRKYQTAPQTQSVMAQYHAANLIYLCSFQECVYPLNIYKPSQHNVKKASCHSFKLRNKIKHSFSYEPCHAKRVLNVLSILTTQKHMFSQYLDQDLQVSV